jgi:SNF2 family DNA or RNA helicase
MGFFMLGRSKAIVQVGMPEKRRETYYVDVEMSAPTVADANEAIAKSNAVARALRATARAKRPAVVAQTVEALQAGQKVVVFTYLREQAEQVAKAVKAEIDCSVQCVNGDMSPEQRDAQATEFRQMAAPAAFVATVDSIGVSLSLVGAELVIFADLLYEPWKLIQAEGRTHRFDSPCKVLVRYLIATGTIDEAMVESVISKLATIEAAMGKEDDSTALVGLLAPNPIEAEAVVDRLFEKLKAWGARA